MAQVNGPNLVPFLKDWVFDFHLWATEFGIGKETIKVLDRERIVKVDTLQALIPTDVN